jgi:hypothetical protein
MSLDDFVLDSKLSRVDFVKMDVEGAELAVLTGARDTIRHFRPKLITEFNPACLIHYFEQDPKDLFELLCSFYPNIFLITETGSLLAIKDYDWLAERITTGKGWEDLFCCF